MMMNVNNAIKPLTEGRVTEQPITPELVLKALRRDPNQFLDYSMEMNPADGQFLGMVGVNVWSFIGLNASALFSDGRLDRRYRAGGLILIGLTALVFPPALLIPVHTIVQLGAAVSLGTSRWRYVVDKLPPFVVGTVIGATIGGQIFIGLSESVLLFILGVAS